ncbi:DUF6326 family protein [Cyclobacterium sp. 1_MG-2023]|uniref:DUF6326 family protein n=1 Tax=Cyclobacterium sp. 1_MG-2023 TaxID=3062681 RepID=UPI0026E2CCB4|nr:DUF6326 family protein [Cyclobacterium sp. 1_MG-2023]MDO6440497.1 DUF6326 family protein [Cyclobacterium sp. 1_MG-2023]
MRTKLSFLWVYVLMNIIIKDIHDLFRPGLLEEMQNGIVNGNTITEELMLIGGILLELPILMIVLSQFLPHNPNKWLNVCVATLSILTLFMNLPKDLDDVFFLITTAIGLLTIIVFALKHKETSNIDK